VKKIAVVLSNTPHDGGGYQYATIILEALKENRNVEILYLCTNSFWSRWCRQLNLPSVRISMPHFVQNEYDNNINRPFLMRLLNMKFTRWGQLIRNEGIEVLLFTNQLEYLPNYDVKTIFPLHDLMHRYEKRFPELSGESDYRDKVVNLQAQNASCIITDSLVGKEQFLESYKNSISRSMEVEVVPFVVPDYIKNELEEYIDVPEKFIFYPAQFWKHKNHLNLIKAVELLKEEIPDIKLVLVGSRKNNWELIRDYIHDNNLDDRIIVKGYVTNGQITYLYKHAVAMIMASYCGPTNIPPLEAMALGCPVAVANRYAMPWQVGEKGAVFDPDSPEDIASVVRRIWNDKVYREELTQNGYTQINKWTKKDFIKKINEIVDNV